MPAFLAGSVELTFDDGPDPVWTRAILAALRGSPLRATFFVVAPLAAEHPELMAVRDGCEETVRFARFMAAEAVAA